MGSQTIICKLLEEKGSSWVELTAQVTLAVKAYSPIDGIGFSGRNYCSLGYTHSLFWTPCRLSPSNTVIFL